MKPSVRVAPLLYCLHCVTRSIECNQRRRKQPKSMFSCALTQSWRHRTDRDAAAGNWSSGAYSAYSAPVGDVFDLVPSLTAAYSQSDRRPRPGRLVDWRNPAEPGGCSRLPHLVSLRLTNGNIAMAGDLSSPSGCVHNKAAVESTSKIVN